MSGRYNNGNNNGNDDGNKFCAVCSSAGRPDFNTHFVRADKFDRNSAITCPYLLSIQCRICGGNGHTASYCKFQSQSSQLQSRPQRLPPISSLSQQQHSSQSQQQHRAPPRIVFETSNPQKTERINFERAFPPLKSNRLTLPPLPLSHVSSRVRSDEPLLRRGPPEASPVHSPAPKKRSNNPFAALASSSDSEDSDYYSPVAVASSPDGVGRCRRQKSSASWISVVTASPVHEAAAVKFPPRVAPRLAPLAPRVAPRVAPLAPLAPPLVFKSNAKPNWGDTDSEDDEEFLKKGGQ